MALAAVTPRWKARGFYAAAVSDDDEVGVHPIQPGETNWLEFSAGDVTIRSKPGMQSDSQSTRASLLFRLRDTHNAEAWQQFVEIYGPITLGFCRRQGLQDADAADVSQEVMRAVSRSMETFEYDRQRGRFRNWLLTVTRSKLNNFLNSRRRQPEPHGNTSLQNLMDQEPGSDEQSNWDTEYHGRLFQWAAEQVRPSIQEATWLAFWRTAIEEQDASKVAAELHLSVGAVYVAKSRVLARLREKILEVDEQAAFTPPSDQRDRVRPPA